MEFIWIIFIIAAFAFDKANKEAKKTRELEERLNKLEGKPLEEVIKPITPTEKYQWGRKDKE